MKRPHAIVVGGTRGIGRAVARSFAAEGCAVSIVGRRPPAGGSGGKYTRHWTLDVRDPAAIEATVPAIVKWGGPITRLVFLQRFRGDGDAWQGEIDTTLTATRLFIDASSSRFAKKGGAIVVVSSIADRFVAAEQPLGYHVAKAGLTQLARYYAVVLGKQRIRVNAVSSGTIVKDESRSFYRDQKALRTLYESMIPLGRMGTADDIAAVVSFLCSPAASFVTGQALVVDGGVSLQWHESLVRGLSALKNLVVTRRNA